MSEAVMGEAGKPSTIKLINQSIIRERFMGRKPLACAEISSATGISITTVRAVMNEMLDREEIISLGFGESSGGRKSEQFIINDDCYHGVTICITEYFVYSSLINIHSEVLDTQEIAIDKRRDMREFLLGLLDNRITKKTKVVGIGVPGVVAPDGYIRKKNCKLTDHVDLLSLIRQHISLPIILENDLRASALGFSKEIRNDSMIAFINFEDNCSQVSAGFVEAGKIIRGMGNYAGELGLMPFDNQCDFSGALYSVKDDKERAAIIARLVAWICCSFNPRHVMLCNNNGPMIHKTYIEKYLSEWLPATMLPELTVGSRFEQYYIKGMAALTAGTIFN